jgi:hypothetical protein
VGFDHDGGDGFVPPTPVPGHLVLEAREPWGCDAFAFAHEKGHAGHAVNGGVSGFGQAVAAMVRTGLAPPPPRGLHFISYFSSSSKVLKPPPS